MFRVELEVKSSEFVRVGRTAITLASRQSQTLRVTVERPSRHGSKAILSAVGAWINVTARATA